MFIIKEHRVPNDSSGIMLMDYALTIFPEFITRSSIKKAIKRGELLVDGKLESSGFRVKPYQIITLIDLEAKPPKPLDYPLDIIYEDEHLAVINKPAGIEVSGNSYFTIQNALVSNIKISAEQDALRWARPVHRLDRPTTGLLLVAKTKSSLINLGHQFENNLISKRYRALVAGYIPESGMMNTPIDGKDSITNYVCIKRSHSLKTEWISLVELFPQTGRKHQLRIHLAECGFPIVGEKQYGEGPVLRGKGLFLAAVELSFNQPKTKEAISISIDQPKKFDSFMKKEDLRWEEFQLSK